MKYLKSIVKFLIILLALCIIKIFKASFLILGARLLYYFYSLFPTITNPYAPVIIVCVTLLISIYLAYRASVSYGFYEHSDIEYHTKHIVITSAQQKIRIAFLKEDLSTSLIWEDAQTASENAEESYRLPTLLEAELIYSKYLELSKYFSKGYYWTSTIENENEVWAIDFTTGQKLSFNKNCKLSSKAVRTIQYTD